MTLLLVLSIIRLLIFFFKSLNNREVFRDTASIFSNRIDAGITVQQCFMILF